MATVKFSKDLNKQIEINANKKMQLAVDRAKETRPDNSWGQVIYDTLFAGIKPIISQVPAEWLKTVDRIEIEQVGDTPCSLKFTFATPVPWPNVFVTTTIARKERTYSDGIVLTDEYVWSEFYTEVVAYKERVGTALKRQREFVEMVSKVVGTYGTLAPALKAWPPLWDLIPEDVKNKHREIVERVKKEVTLDVDINKLTAMAAFARIT